MTISTRRKGPTVRRTRQDWLLSLLCIVACRLLPNSSTVQIVVQALQATPRNATMNAAFSGNHSRNHHPLHHLHPVFCHNLSPQACQEEDVAEGVAREKLRHFLTPSSRLAMRRQKQRFLRRKQRLGGLIKETQVVEEEEAQPQAQAQTKAQAIRQFQEPAPGLEDPTGSDITILVCLLVWTDQEERLGAVNVQSYNNLMNADGIDAALYPSGSVNRYLRRNSYENFSPNFIVVNWALSDNAEAFYATQGDRGRSPELQLAFDPVLEQLDRTGFDFAQVDSDFDRSIDLTLFLHSGYDAILGGVDCNTDAPASQRIASHARSSARVSQFISRAGYTLGAYAVASAFDGLCGFDIARLGVLTHEILHPFGLPDLYDLALPFQTTGNLGGIDQYDLMARPAGPGPADIYAFPGYLSAWSQMQLGWVTPIEITRDGTYTARPKETHADVYIIRDGFQPSEYLLLENRQPIPGDFDQAFWAPGGMTIYHIDENNLSLPEDPSVTGNHNPGFPGQPGWPGNNQHYAVALLQRDGLYQLEQGLNPGHIQDVYYLPEHELGPGNGEQVATNAGTYPNTDSYTMGQVSVTGIRIFNFRAQTGGSLEAGSATRKFGKKANTNISAAETKMQLGFGKAHLGADGVTPMLSRQSGEGATMLFDIEGLQAALPTNPPTPLPQSAPTSVPTLLPSLPPVSGQPVSGPPVDSPFSSAPSSSPTAFPTQVASFEGTTEVPVPVTFNPTEMLVETLVPSVFMTPRPVTLSPTQQPTQRPTERPPTSLAVERPTMTRRPTDMPFKQKEEEEECAGKGKGKGTFKSRGGDDDDDDDDGSGVDCSSKKDKKDGKSDKKSKSTKSSKRSKKKKNNYYGEFLGVNNGKGKGKGLGLYRDDDFENGRNEGTKKLNKKLARRSGLLHHFSGTANADEDRYQRLADNLHK